MIEPLPAEVLGAYGLEGSAVVPVPGGLINPTFRVDVSGRPVCVVQRLHPIFAPEVNLDIDAITRHIFEAGLDTPSVWPTLSGALWVTVGGKTYRALKFIPGVTVHQFSSPHQAESAGQLVARFHQAVSDLQHRFAFERVGVHDTASHLSRLTTCMNGSTAAAEKEPRELARDVLAAAADLPSLPNEPRRICHGDLKVSNIRFAEDGTTARCLIDLDTLGMMTIGYEMGDALRSWCNPRGEDQGEPEIDLDLCRAGLGAYAAGFGQSLSPAERQSIPDGLETVCIELAARFCRDVFEDSYFGWDATRFGSRKEHNLVRARGQLALGRSVRRHRNEIRSMI